MQNFIQNNSLSYQLQQNIILLFVLLLISSCTTKTKVEYPKSLVITVKEQGWYAFPLYDKDIEVKENVTLHAVTCKKSVLQEELNIQCLEKSENIIFFDQEQQLISSYENQSQEYQRKDNFNIFYNKIDKIENRWYWLIFLGTKEQFDNKKPIKITSER